MPDSLSEIEPSLTAAAPVSAAPVSALEAFGVPTDEELAAGVLAAPPMPVPMAAPAAKMKVTRPLPVAGDGTRGSDPFAAAGSSDAAPPVMGDAGAIFTTTLPSDTNEALREAIKSGETGACLELIRSKADPNFRDRQGNYPLHMACLFGRTEVAEALLVAGANPEMQNAAGELPSRMASLSLRMKMKEFQETGTFV